MLKLPDAGTLFHICGGAAIKVSCGFLTTLSAIAQPNRPPPRTPDPVYPVPASATSQLPIHKPWTLLASKVAGNLNSTVSKEYLYVYQDRWYVSPATKLSWSWDLGQEVPGTYKYFDGSTTGAGECRGSTEYPTFGIGCSEGAGNTRKVLPWNAAITATAKGTKSPSTGQGTVCQEASRAFGPGPCYQATIYVREVYDLLTDVVAPRLQPATTKSYLYLYQDRWYRSAATTLSWNWGYGQQLAGTYDFFNGTSSGTVQCVGSSEQPSVGIGCSEGGGNTRKVLPWTGWITSTLQGAKYPTTGQVTVCQDSSGAFGSEPCYVATIYVLER